jgi:hypothetical protein
MGLQFTSIINELHEHLGGSPEPLRRVPVSPWSVASLLRAAADKTLLYQAEAVEIGTPLD